MRQSLIAILLFFSAAFLSVGITPLSKPISALAQESSLYVAHAWARASAGPAKNGAVYLVIHMKSNDHDRLVALATPASKKASLHTHIEEDGVLKMRPLNALEVGPGEHKVLKPGGDHIMLLGLEKKLKEGESITLTLTFEKAGEIVVEVPIKGVAATGPGYSHGDHGSGGHSGHKHGGHGRDSSQSN